MVYERKIKYTTISISEPLMNEIKEYIEDKSYVSVGEFVRDSIRKNLEVR